VGQRIGGGRLHGGQRSGGVLRKPLRRRRGWPTIDELPQGVVHVFHVHVDGVESDVQLALVPGLGLGCSALLLLLVGPRGLGCSALLLLVGVHGAEAV